MPALRRCDVGQEGAGLVRYTPDEAQGTVLEAGGDCKAHSTRITSLNTAPSPCFICC